MSHGIKGGWRMLLGVGWIGWGGICRTEGGWRGDVDGMGACVGLEGVCW